MCKRWVETEDGGWGWVPRKNEPTPEQIAEYGPGCDKRYAPGLWLVSKKLYRRLEDAYAELRTVSDLIQEEIRKERGN